ncbi:hypothetical protein [Tychonema sp. LEGE 06208]|uniref:hypothetical protein n=1 Tax=Tychonema sp. LEGE 06208 TaxID=1828663 RepID=UPI0018824B69|nr:hypothetical protein [Tychonema sp. LEGE 06208]MBE9162101.1 hypothetical protein [Tychonema sp. LEGE 06208]
MTAPNQPINPIFSPRVILADDSARDLQDLPDLGQAKDSLLCSREKEMSCCASQLCMVIEGERGLLRLASAPFGFAIG